jgi:acyl carrier protein phosphodiesterase
MNFFAHAVVASQQNQEARFVLGAMLPDFASMASLRLMAVHDTDLAEGVALHHETDRRFHACAPFRALCESALNELEAAGVSRGAARAVGHVGSELLLDGVLSHDVDACATYSRALSVGREASFEHAVRFKEAPDAGSLRDLFDWLADGPLPVAYRDVDFVGERLQRILSRRPRLALRPADHATVRAWLQQARTIVERDAAALLAAQGA